jgi:menaquinone-dependent protoporphyrinogen IX oxidase
MEGLASRVEPFTLTESELGLMSSSDLGANGPQVLFVYFTYTQQSLKVAEAMAAVLRERGWGVSLARVELTDSRWSERFTRFPLRHALFDILGMMPAQLRGATGEISIPEEARTGDYDLVVIGSPTWWIKTSVPIRSYLKSDAAGRILTKTRFATFVVCRRYWGFNLRGVKKLGAARGGEYVDGIHFSFAGGQVRSLLSLISYFGKGENRDRYLGVRIPPTNLKPDYLDQAQAFATRLADRLGDARSAPAAPTGTGNGQPTDTNRVEHT